jgi:hypothetical protein
MRVQPRTAAWCTLRARIGQATRVSEHIGHCVHVRGRPFVRRMPTSEKCDYQRLSEHKGRKTNYARVRHRQSARPWSTNIPPTESDPVAIDCAAYPTLLSINLPQVDRCRYNAELESQKLKTSHKVLDFICLIKLSASELFLFLNFSTHCI